MVNVSNMLCLGVNREQHARSKDGLRTRLDIPEIPMEEGEFLHPWVSGL